MQRHGRRLWLLLVPACFIVAAHADNPGTLLWSTFLGGSTEDINQDIVTDSQGNVYVCGTTQSADFPATPGAFDTSFNGGSTIQYGGDSWVAKFDGQSGALVWATYIGGMEDEEPYGMWVNEAGEVILLGATASYDFPTTPGAYDTSFNGEYDLYLLKLSADGDALVFSTLFGGYNYDGAWEETAPALDPEGNIYVTGFTHSFDYPATPGSYDTTYSGVPDVFVTKFTPDGSAILYSTFLGGTSFDQGQEIKVNAVGEAYVAGRAGYGFPITEGAYLSEHGNGLRESFVAKLNAAGSELMYSTYFGGSESEGEIDFVTGLALDPSGDVYVCGVTTSPDFPVTPGAYDGGAASSCFVTRINADGSDVVASARFWEGWIAGLERDAEGSIWLAGYTPVTDMPVTAGAYQSAYAGGVDSFVAEMSGDLVSLLYCSYIGGTSDESDTRVAIDSAGNVFVGGWTFSADFPLTPGAVDTDWGTDLGESFICRLAPAANPHIYVNGGNVGVEDGLTWSTGFNTIQEGVDAAALAGAPEVWVKSGIYDEARSSELWGVDSGSVLVHDGISMIGGFAGTETRVAQRDWVANPTIIDGATSRSGQPAYHVLFAIGSITVDGLTVRGGRAQAAASGSFDVHNIGGGLSVFGGSARVLNTSFEANDADFGGAMAVASGSIVLTHGTVVDNSATTGAGGIFSFDSTLSVGGTTFGGNTGNYSGAVELWLNDHTFGDCSFTNNSGGNAGAVFVWGGGPMFDDCTFTGNVASAAGGVAYNFEAQTQFNRCIMDSNEGVYGGAISNWYSTPAFTNCLITNSTGSFGGAIANVYSYPNLRHCTLADNSATSSGGALYDVESVATVMNSILWNNTPEEFVESGAGTAEVSSSIVRGGWSGSGNLDSDPLFVGPTDYSLQATSPAVDSADYMAAPPDDLAGVARPKGFSFDRGAYESH